MTVLVTNNTFAQTRKNLRSERQRDDFYRTPATATEALLAVEAFSGWVWEPACGDGAISKVLTRHGIQVFSEDLIDYGFGFAGRDFLLTRGLAATQIITNPPFKLADEFALHALELGATKIALLCRLAWLEGAARHQRLWSKHPPSRVWTFCRRQTLWKGDDPNAQDKGGAIAFAWFVWDAAHQGETVLRWLPGAPRAQGRP